MTFPGIPFPPATPLFPAHDHYLKYLTDVVTSKKLDSYFHVNHDVTAAEYNHALSKWDVQITDSEGRQQSRQYDHLIIANGHFKYPRVPDWKGVDEWKAAAPPGQREVVHSLWYRGPEPFAGRTVVVVGFGGSGWDIAKAALTTATEVARFLCTSESSRKLTF
jgi:cation diffusion facilitator CzcD-associated flavoprotein CzcO